MRSSSREKSPMTSAVSSSRTWAPPVPPCRRPPGIRGLLKCLQARAHKRRNQLPAMTFIHAPLLCKWNTLMVPRRENIFCRNRFPGKKLAYGAGVVYNGGKAIDKLVFVGLSPELTVDS